VPYLLLLEPGGAVGDGVVAQFRRRFDAMLGDPEAAYLYAYSLFQKDTPKTVENLSTVARQTPGSANRLADVGSHLPFSRLVRL
jgi:hypothetical protein